MGKSSPSLPTAPDPTATANAQAAANSAAARETAELNRYNVNSPYGTQTWDRGYSDADQQQLDQYQQDLNYYNTTTLPAWQQAQQAAPQQNSGQYYQNSDSGGGGGQQQQTAYNPMPQAPTRPDVYPSQYTQNIALTPDGQANLDLQNQLTNQSLTYGNAQLGRVAQSSAQPMDLSGLPSQVSGLRQTIGGQPMQATTGNSNLYGPAGGMAGAQQGAGGQGQTGQSFNQFAAQATGMQQAPQQSAQQRFQALGAQLQGADPTQAAQAQGQFFQSLGAGDVGGIIRDNPSLGAMALGNAGQRLATIYGPGQGDAVARWTQGVQDLMAQGMDVASAHNQVLGQFSGGDLAAVLQNPAAANYGAAARGAIAQAADQLAAAKDRPDQGAGAIQRQLDTSQLQAMPSVYAQQGDDPYGMDMSRQAVEDALYQRTTARLDPQWQEQEQALASQLANQGIPIGSAAYNAEMDRFSRAKNDAYAAAMNDATLAGGGEQSRLFGLGLAGRQQGFNESLAGGQFSNAAQNQAYGQASNTRQQLFGEGMATRQQDFTEGMQTGQQDFYQQQTNAQLQNAARERALQEQLMLRNQPFNELAALLGTSGGVQMPQFGQPAQVGVQAPDIQGATYNSYAGQMNAYNAGQQSQAAGMQGLGSLLGTGAQAAAMAWGGPAAAAAAPAIYGLGYSDRRLKRDVERIGTAANGLPVYSFRYLWRPETFIGHMADEVRKVAPWAVQTVGGFDAVNYAALDGC